MPRNHSTVCTLAASPATVCVNATICSRYLVLSGPSHLAPYVSLPLHLSLRSSGQSSPTLSRPTPSFGKDTIPRSSFSFGALLLLRDSGFHISRWSFFLPPWSHHAGEGIPSPTPLCLLSHALAAWFCVSPILDPRSSSEKTWMSRCRVILTYSPPSFMLPLHSTSSPFFIGNSPCMPLVPVF